MIVNFKTRGISRDARKLTLTITLNLKRKKIYIYIYIYIFLDFKWIRGHVSSNFRLAVSQFRL